MRITVPDGEQKAYLRKMIIDHQMNINFRTNDGKLKTTHQLGMEINKWKLANDGEIDNEITFE